MIAPGTEELPPRDPHFMAASGAFLECCDIIVSDSGPVLVEMPQEMTLFFCFGGAFLFLLAWENLLKGRGLEIHHNLLVSLRGFVETTYFSSMRQSHGPAHRYFKLASHLKTK